MDEESRIRLGNERKLIFRNICNGVPAEQICVAYRRSELELQREVFFVWRKINEYRFQGTTRPNRDTWDATTRSWEAPGGGPLFKVESYAEIRLHRLTLLATLDRLGPLTLTCDLVLPAIHMHKMDSKDACIEVSHRMKGHGSPA